MALHPDQPTNENPRDDPAIPDCPICAGRLETVYNRHNQRVCVCMDCRSGLTIPGPAWEIARTKWEAKQMHRP